MSSIKTLSVKDLSSLIKISTHSIHKCIKEHNLEIIPKGNMKVLPPETVFRILEIRGFILPRVAGGPIVINLCGTKGGIGKTSLATSIAEGLSRLGFKVLGVDLDMQANFTQSFNQKVHGQSVIYHVITQECNIDDSIRSVSENLDLLPSSLDNSQLEYKMNSMQEINITKFFKDLFNPIISKYDVIVIDCPPALNKVTACAFCFATTNLIPVNADIDSFDGVVMTVAEMDKIKKSFCNTNLEMNYSVVFNKYDAREKLTLDIMGKISERENLKENMLPVVVRTNTAFKNSKADGCFVFDLRKSSAKEDCFTLVSELIGLTDWSDASKGIRSSRRSEVETVAA
jgi:chromosome partitioning protein